MFEDSTFESNHQIRTRSRRWMLAALALNSTILLALVLIPLVYPEAIPSHAMLFLMEAPPPPAAVDPATPHPQHMAASPAAEAPNPFTAPRQIPTSISFRGDSNPFGSGDVFRPAPPPVVVHPAPKTVRLPSTLAAGLLIRKVIPIYPALAKEMRQSGTVVLAATISKDGAISNLRVVSGPAVLQQSAIDAVSQWRYRPYLLNGQPVEVETTINVIFTLAN